MPYETNPIHVHQSETRTNTLKIVVSISKLSIMADLSARIQDNL